jgi:hypothetical protein
MICAVLALPNDILFQATSHDFPQLENHLPGGMIKPAFPCDISQVYHKRGAQGGIFFEEWQEIRG